MARRSLTGCRAIVTGASSGIGRALTEQLVRAGSRVVALARRPDRLQALSAALSNAPGQLAVFVGDVTSGETRHGVLAYAEQQFGGLDLVINNAGIGAMGRFAEADPERLRRVMEVNFFAPAELMRLAVPILQGGSHPMIVNVGSILGHRGIPLCAEYCASKFALQGLSESLRAEFSKKGIDLLVVSPGTTQTEFFEQAIDAAPTPWSGRRGVSPQVVARRTLRGIVAGRHEIVVGASGKLLLWLNRLAPAVLDRVMARFG